MIEPKRFVRKIWQALPREAPKEETGKWSMGEGIVWLRGPEMWCPHCGVSWINPWTWLVNVKRGRVEGVWEEDGSKLSLYDLHPHMMSTGEICTGRGNVIEAITSGFNINSCFCGKENFHEVMADLGHEECGQEGEEEEDDRMVCESCYERYDDDYISYYEQCSQVLCDGCWQEVSVRCDNCHDRFYYPENGSQESPLTMVRGGDKFCESCLEDYIYCHQCDEYVHYEDMRSCSSNEDPICERCWLDARKECDACPELVLKEDLMDELCEKCREEWEAEVEQALEDVQLNLPLKAGEVEDGTKD